MALDGFVTIIYNWQTLIGSAIGPFLAVTLSLLGFFIRYKYLLSKERKEFLRRIEVSVTRSIDDMYDTKAKLKVFVSKLREMAYETRKIDDEITYDFEEINFPYLKDIFLDTDLPNFKIKSYYLHNKLLIIDKGIKNTNNSYIRSKEGFSTLMANNKFLIALKDKPNRQRETYARNIEGFADSMETSLTFLEEGITILMQCKVYNSKLREGEYSTLCEYEGIGVGCSKNKKDKNQLASLERIDETIKEEVNYLLAEIEGRISKFKNKK